MVSDPSPPSAAAACNPSIGRRLEGRTALVTGALSGIGQAAADRLEAEGARVFRLDLSPAEGERRIAADVSDLSAWRQVAELIRAETPTLDILVNSAGIFGLGSLAEHSAESFYRFFAVNQLGPALGIKALLPLLRRAGNASVVNVASGAALFGFDNALGYMSSKWGLRGASRALARELAPEVRVNCIFPGLIDTPMAGINSAERQSDIAERTPLKRIGRPEEVAAAIAFLASDDASYITGSELTIDGGICA